MDLLLGLALSAHMEFEENYNGVHPHIRLETEQVVAGMYYNSMERMSVYVGKEFTFDNYFIEGGVVTGYNAIGPIVPYVRAGVNVTDNINVFVAPGFETRHGDLNIHTVVGIEIFKKVF